ncbi:universal stress protein [Thiolapillus brandeum]|uniref:Universal stress protein domain protein n=1 Tax=Thiolapillus brandeum TaxID=1076588 RepID=A0A7U6GJB8_9GAMM|nr:universal stress protein [Thiolapillus brandeum]BAO44696.1 universal stress protein domain protein [Thiolapillus brandeum]
MIEFVPVSEINIFAIRASGKLTDADYQQFLPRLEKLIGECGPVSLMIELVDFRGWEPKAAWDDFRFGMEHDKDFLRIAIVGQKAWQKWMSAIGDAFTLTKIRFFYQNSIQDAWDWLRTGDENVLAAEAVPAGLLNQAPDAYRNILVALDFTPHSQKVLARALEAVRFYNAKLSLIHAVENTFYPDLGNDLAMYDPAEFVEFDQKRHDRAVMLMDKLARELDYPNVQHEVIWGGPNSAILSYAEAQKADLIVVGSHGRHGLAKLLGSTAAAIVHNARCDVFVVRLPDQ